MRTTESRTRSQPDCVELLMAGVMAAYLEIALLVIDVSPSMEEDDWCPSRLQGAKDACIAFIGRKTQFRPQDLVGIVPFASGARIEQLPLPVGVNRAKLEATVNRLSTDSGTNVGAGLAKAETAFNGGTLMRDLIAGQGFFAWLFSSNAASFTSRRPRANPNEARRIVLLSDGAHNGNIEPIPVAQRLISNGVEIDCIGIGGSRKSVDEELLKEIASRDERGEPRYWFIGNRIKLIKKFEDLANGLRCIDS